MKTWKPRSTTLCANCQLPYPDHAKSLLLPSQTWRTAHPDACDQFTEPPIVPSVATLFINEITRGLDWLTAKVLSMTVGRKH